MKDLFLVFLDLLDGRGNITEALMYESGEFSKITLENENGTFTVAISKKKEETDGNGND